MKDRSPGEFKERILLITAFGKKVMDSQYASWWKSRRQNMHLNSFVGFAAKITSMKLKAISSSSLKTLSATSHTRAVKIQRQCDALPATGVHEDISAEQTFNIANQYCYAYKLH
jgi:hypothetical protein